MGEENINENEEYSAVLKLCGVDEGEVREKCGEFIKPEGNPAVKLFYDAAKGPEVMIKIHSTPEGELSAKKVAKPVVKEFKNSFGEKIYAMDEESTLEEVVVVAPYFPEYRVWVENAGGRGELLWRAVVGKAHKRCRSLRYFQGRLYHLFQ